MFIEMLSTVNMATGLKHYGSIRHLTIEFTTRAHEIMLETPVTIVWSVGLIKLLRQDGFERELVALIRVVTSRLERVREGVQCSKESASVKHTHMVRLSLDSTYIDIDL